MTTYKYNRSLDEIERERGRQTDRQTDIYGGGGRGERERETETETETDRHMQTCGETEGLRNRGRQTHKETDGQTDSKADMDEDCFAEGRQCTFQ